MSPVTLTLARALCTPANTRTAAMDKHPDMLAAYEAAAAMIAKAKADGKFLGIQIPPMPEEDLKLPSLLRFVLEYLPVRASPCARAARTG